MVNSIKDNIPASNVKSRDNRQKPAGPSVGKRVSREAAPAAQSALGSELKSPQDSTELTTSSLSIVSENIEAAAVNIEDKEKADKVLQSTIEMMQQNPETAELAQANIRPRVALALLQNK